VLNRLLCSRIFPFWKFFLEIIASIIFTIRTDTPPGTSDEHLTVVAALKSSRPDGAIIVTTPQEISLSVVKKEVRFVSRAEFRTANIPRFQLQYTEFDFCALF
jgi:hypothetical protein